MHDFLDRFPPEHHDPVIELAGQYLARWARSQEVMRMVVRHHHSTEFEVLYNCPEAMSNVY